MAFNSFEFALFFAVTFGLFLATDTKRSWIVLLLSSIVFYGALLQPHLLLVLAGVTFVSFLCATGIEKSGTEAGRRAFLWVGILGTLLPLFYLRYLHFVVDTLESVLGLAHDPAIGSTETVLSSVGVSFYCFQAISYLADVHSGYQKAERHFGYFALYLAFFPKLLQGPIERGNVFLPQLRQPFMIRYETMRYAAVLFAWGLFKKVAIADGISPLVDPVYESVHSFHGLALCVATALYAVQIFADFSGYTDMALGVGAFFGIRLTQNFASPYYAWSIPEFWRRWHISLSEWLMHYLFMPLQRGLIRWRKAAAPAAVVVTFLICGIWHGANWTYVIWGGINGVYLAVSYLTKKTRARLVALVGLNKHRSLHRSLQVCITFALVCFAWIWFRASTVSDAVYVVKTILLDPLSVGPGHGLAEFVKQNFLLGRPWKEFIVPLLLISVLATIEFLNHSGKTLDLLFRKPLLVRWAFYYLLVLSTIFLGQFEKRAFIYLQF